MPRHYLVLRVITEPWNRSRSFIAIELPEELRLELKRLQASLKTGGQSEVKWVDPYSIHLTLKFLGGITLSQVDDVLLAMEEAAAGIPPFQLEVKALGAFPNLRRVQVVWVGLGGEIDKLSQLARQLEDNLADLSFPRESRPFTAHLTLARVRERASPAEREALGKTVTATSLDVDYVIHVKEISLMKSQLTREGAIYSRIASVPLGQRP